MTSSSVQTSISEDWFERAGKVMPGGVNSPVRAFRSVGGAAPFVTSGQGARVVTADGEVLIDLVASWGALIFGHADPQVTAAVVEAVGKGSSFGMPTTAEVELAELICQIVPSIDVVRMVNSGTEATASLLRLARAATGRDTVIKFEGCYHGHSDSFLVSAGSGLATYGQPSSPGVPTATAAGTRVARFNDVDSVASLLDEDVAAVIVEPVAGNMGCIPPQSGFLESLRSLCDESGALLVFDEVMTGFRVALGGAQSRFGVTPDLTALGKVVAGGTPGAAYGGREELMRMIAPAGPVYQAGTLAGTPLVTAAGLATLRLLVDDPGVYDRFEEAGNTIARRLGVAFDSVSLPGVVTYAGGMVGVFLGIDQATTWDDVADLDQDLFRRFFHAALRRGVLLPPSPFETWFLMTSHLDDTREEVLVALEESIFEAAS